MGKENTLTINYLRNNEVFADIVNFILRGNHKVNPKDLQEADPVKLLVIPDKEEPSPKYTMEKIRDIEKHCVVKSDGNVTYMIIGVESQSLSNYEMPVRTMLYDAINYDQQVKEKYKMGKKSGSRTGSSYISRLNKGDKLKPVITITVYWGEEEWDGPVSLHEMLEAPPEILDMIPNYPLFMVNAKAMAETDIDAFESNFGKVLKIMKYARDEKLYNSLMRNTEFMESLESEDIILLAGLNYLKVNEEDYKGGTVDMCKAWDDNMARSREEGIKEGVFECKNSIVEKMLRLGQPLAIIIMVSEFTESAIREIAARIGVAIVE